MAEDDRQTQDGGVMRWSLLALALLVIPVVLAVFYYEGGGPEGLAGQTGNRSAVERNRFSGGEATFRGERYFYVEMSREAPDLQLIWRDERGANYTTIEAVQRDVDAHGRRLVFATNAGIFAPDFAPLGLHIEDGERLTELDLQTARSGNFYLLPNGVFVMPEDGPAEIVESAEFHLAPETLRFATQSGPMLVIDGALHPRFQEGSQNKYIRSGVGVCDGDRLVFALSRAPVSFYDIASLFRDQFSCPNALYLDGAISRMHAPELGQVDLGGRFVGMLVVTKPAE